MKFAAKTFIAFTLACTLGASAAFAADPAPAATPPGKPLTPQQQKMSDCNQGAKAQTLKGPEYKAFMSTCLKKDGSATPVAAKPAAAATAAATPAPAATTAVTQQQKMKTCNADPQAKTLKGDDRKKFMSTCLSAPAAAH
jgi:hypothetical protein